MDNGGDSDDDNSSSTSDGGGELFGFVELQRVIRSYVQVINALSSGHKRRLHNFLKLNSRTAAHTVNPINPSGNCMYHLL